MKRESGRRVLGVGSVVCPFFAEADKLSKSSYHEREGGQIRRFCSSWLVLVVSQISLRAVHTLLYASINYTRTVRESREHGNVQSSVGQLGLSRAGA